MRDDRSPDGRGPVGVPSALQRRALASLVATAVILLVLVAMPIGVALHERAHWRFVTDVLDPARVAVNDLEAAQAMMAVGDALALDGDTAAADSVRREARQVVARDLAELTRAATTLGVDAVERLVLLRDAIDEEPPPGLSAAARARRQAAAVDATDHFERWLTERARAERAETRRLEQWSQGMTALLVPLALVAMLLVARSGRQVVALADAAARDHAALRESTAAKSALMHGVTHDLKNPLGAALGYVSLLEEGLIGPLDPQARGVVTRIRHLLDTTVHALQDLLELARAESRELAIAPRPIDLGVLAAECARDHEAVARGAGLALTAAPPPRPVQVSTDPARVRQILENLIGNAVKYTPAGGHVAVAVDHADGRARIVVTDDGPGVPAEHRERVFEEFFRLPSHDGGDGAPAGTGVGLAISRRLARRLGGDLTVGAAEGGGAAFVLVLPGTAVTRDPGRDS
ncbi:MAG: HAMP domain-containing histidine kinase [Gemmatirosa sp.]|nr:HAMP domain-containing histidine kinase [Gemmatirosa sp.]